jgi:hypothetical protein
MFSLSKQRAWPSRLTAFARSAEPRPALSSTALGFDALLACVAVIASLKLEPHFSSPSDHAGLAAVLTSTAPLALRRVYPIAVFWVVLLGVVAVSSYASFITLLALVFAACSAIVHSRFRGAAVLSVVLAGLLVTADLAAPSVWGECDALNHRSAAAMRAAGMTPIEASAEGDLRFRADCSWRAHGTAQIRLSEIRTSPRRFIRR